MVAGSTNTFGIRQSVGEGQALRMDIDEDSGVPVQDQLREALNQNAVRIIDLFRDWDDDQSGDVSKQEFRKAMAQLGFEKHVSEIDALFDSFDPDGSGLLSYRELNKLLRRGGPKPPEPAPVMIRRRETRQERAERLAMEAERAETLGDLDRFDTNMKAMQLATPTMRDSSWGYSVPLTGGGRYANFASGKPKQPPPTLRPQPPPAAAAPPSCAPPAAPPAAPDEGSLTTKSQNKHGLRKAARAEGQVMDLDIDENSDVPVREQIRQALNKNSVRVIDLFRDWDDDQSGSVSKKEFRKAMNQFGLDAHRKEVDALFDSWDPDHSGSIEYKELNKLLRRGGA